jgi:WXXGXW repeat (2 copies)
MEEMKMKRKTLLAICLALPLFAASAYGFVEVRVRTAPPPLRAEVIPRAPSPGHYWAGGHWGWEHGAWAWHGGHWIEARAGQVWVRPHWEQVGAEWVYRPEHWAPIVAPAGIVAVTTDVAPPVPQVEVIPVAPSANHFWVPGYWRWDGHTHVWVGGRWELTRAREVWVPQHWVHDGGHWRFNGGQWPPR